VLPAISITSIAFGSVALRDPRMIFLSPSSSRTDRYVDEYVTVSEARKPRACLLFQLTR
jgi:hypothetical protein